MSRLGSSVEAGGDKEPITLFHLRDALTVSEAVGLGSVSVPPEARFCVMHCYSFILYGNNYFSSEKFSYQSL